MKLHEIEKDTRTTNSPVSIQEKAQYEVFKNGMLRRETIEKWLRQDLRAIVSLVSALEVEPKLMEKLVDIFYDRYQAQHPQKENEND